MRFDDRSSSLFAVEIMFVLSLFSSAISQSIGDVRLVNASGVEGGNEGRVEVYSNHGRRAASWARLCGVGWNNDIASVVCRQLGFQDKERFYRNGAPFGQGSQGYIIRLDSCLSGTEATTLNELQCVSRGGGGKTCQSNPDAGVKCVEQPVNSLPPLNMKRPTPAVETTPTRDRTSRSRRRITTPTMESSTTSQMTSTISTSVVSTSKVESPTPAPDVDIVTSDLMTTDDYVTLAPLPMDLKVAAIYIGVPTVSFIVVIIVIIMVLCHRCKGKGTNTKPTGRRNGRGSDDRENDFPDNEYQYNAVSPVESDSAAPRISSHLTGEEYQYSPVGSPGNAEGTASTVPKQDSIDEYQYSAVGPIQNGVKANPRVPTQDSIDEYQYSAVGQIQNGAGTEPRLPNQDSLDEYQYSAVGPLQNGASASPRFPQQDYCDDSVYAPVGDSSSGNLTPTSTALANVCTDEGLYIVPNTSAVNPYQELTVKTSTFAGLQKLKKKPVAEQNMQQTPEVKMQKKSALEQNKKQVPEVNVVKAAKKPPVTPKKPVMNQQTSTDGASVRASRVPHQHTEISNAVYGLEEIGPLNTFAASSPDGQPSDQGESIYANDIEMWEIHDDQTIHGGYGLNVGENPYENSMIGDQSFLQDNEDSNYQALSRKATLPV